MCGRIFVKPSLTLDQLLYAFQIFDLVLPTIHNAAPTEHLPFLFPTKDGFQVNMMRWSLHPGWLPTPPPWPYATFNARIENIASSKAFSGALQNRRGIALMSGFVEWQTENKIIETGVTKTGKVKTKTQKIKHPFYADCIDQPLIVAGVWEVWRDQVWSFAIITQPADESFAPYHSRMPLSLTLEQAHEWMSAANTPSGMLAELAGSTLPLRVRSISPTINNAKNKIDVEFSQPKIKLN